MSVPRSTGLLGCGDTTIPLVVLLVVCLAQGCSARRYLINRVGDALLSGPSVFESEDDLELLRDALPFSLKLMESLVAGSPSNPALSLGTCRAYVLYSNAFVDFEAELAYEVDLAGGSPSGLRCRAPPRS